MPVTGLHYPLGRNLNRYVSPRTQQMVEQISATGHLDCSVIGESVNLAARLCEYIDHRLCDLRVLGGEKGEAIPLCAFRSA